MKVKLISILTTGIFLFMIPISSCNNNQATSLSPSISEQEDVQFTITYFNGSTIVATQSIKKGSDYEPEFDAEPEEGFEFAGWYFDEQFNNPVNGSFEVNENITLYAKFTEKAPDPIYYEVNYDLDGGEGLITLNYSVLENTTFELASSSSLTKKNYIFDGWLCSSDNQTYQESSSYLINGNVTFVAVWARAITITYSVDGEISSEIVKANTEISLKNIEKSKENYTFAGWKINDTIYTIDSKYQTTNDNILAEAMWDGNYQIYLDAAGGSNVSSSLNGNSNTTISLPTPSKDGFDFIGWSDGINTYKDTITIGYENINLVALYENIIPTYEVWFCDWTGTVIEKQVVKEGEGANEPLDTFVYDIPEFNGWNKDFSCITSENTSNGRILIRATYINQDKWMDKSKLLFTYDGNYDGYTVTSSSKLQSDIGTDVYLPCTYNGKPVIGITPVVDRPAAANPEGFYQCHFIQSVTFPSTFKYIPYGAFFNCTGIKSITLNEGLETIGQSAFYSNEALVSVTLPSSLISMGDDAFSQCDKLETVNFLGNKIEVIPLCCFSQDYALVSINLPNSIKKIENSAFGQCSSLQSIIIPENVEEIGQAAFSYCEKLTNVDFKTNKLKRIVINTFYGSGITSITIPACVESIEDKCFGYTPLVEVILEENSQLKTIGSRVFTRNNNLLRFNSSVDGEFNIPDSVITIEEFAFMYVPNIQFVKFSPTSKLEYIGQYAFGCEDISFIDEDLVENKIETINIPASVKYIGENIFYRAPNLKQIIVDSNNKNFIIHEDMLMDINKTKIIAFPLNSSLKELTIPNTVASIPSRIFENAKNLQVISIPDSIETIGDLAFKNIDSLISVNFNCTKISKIPVELFASCDNLTTVNFAANNKIDTIGEQAFKDCVALKNFVLPENVVTIESLAFAYCSNLSASKIFTINNVLTTISDAAFAYSFLNDTTLEIPSSVQLISSNVFYYCTSLTSIKLKENSILDHIGQYAFYKTGITSFDVPQSVTIIDTFAFYFAESLTNVTFDDDCQISTIPWACFQFTALEKITIPSTVTTIEGYAFSQCSLNNIIIPDSVNVLGRYAFYGCPELQSVVLSNNIEKLEIHTFSRCSSLQSINLGTNLKEIGNYCFYADIFTEITISENVARIGMSSFSNCANLTTVYITNTSPATFMNTASGTTDNVAETVFKDTSLENIYVPVNRVANYQASWSLYKDFIKATPQI